MMTSKKERTTTFTYCQVDLYNIQESRNNEVIHKDVDIPSTSGNSDNVGGSKRQLTLNDSFNKTPKKRKICAGTNPLEPNRNREAERCCECRQVLNDTLLSLQFNDCIEMKEQLVLHKVLGGCLDEEDTPTVLINNFTVYDKKKHVCPFDKDLIENNVELYLSGYVKGIGEEGPGVAVKGLGPLSSWWFMGDNTDSQSPGISNTAPGVSTDTVDYYLQEPSDQFKPFMSSVIVKSHLSNVVINFLLENTDPEYEDLINHIESVVPSDKVPVTRYSEDLLMEHLGFILENVREYDEEYPDDPFSETRCIQYLKEWEPVELEIEKENVARKPVARRHKKSQSVSKKATSSQATLSSVVLSTFESYLPKYIIEERGSRIHSEEPDEGSSSISEGIDKLAISLCGKEAEWMGPPLSVEGGRSFYGGFVSRGVRVEVGEFVNADGNPERVVRESREVSGNRVGKVLYLYGKGSRRFAHCGWLVYARDTILGDTADSRELFCVDECEDVPLEKIKSVVSVVYKRPERFGTEEVVERNCYFYKLRYDAKYGRFDDIPVDEGSEADYCYSCNEKYKRDSYEKPAVSEFLKRESKVNGLDCYKTFTYKGFTYRVGDCFYAAPKTIKFDFKLKVKSSVSTPSIGLHDEKKFPEMYRKTDHVKGSNANCPAPLQIARIKSIYLLHDEVKLECGKFYRPGDTHGGSELESSEDLNCLYYSEEAVVLRCAAAVVGPVRVVYADKLADDTDKLFRFECFYFSEMFDAESRGFTEPPEAAKRFYNSDEVDKEIEVRGNVEKLRSLDVFAGCGGLSEGFHQSGVAETRWAIEMDQSAAGAFRENNPGATVYAEDCNKLLRSAMDGDLVSESGLRLPERGQVDLLCGGPPCQGFSGMNRFNTKEYSVFKNSLVPTYLSYCDFYRPRFFLLENVRNFVSFKNSVVLKLTMRCLVAMGYQCRFAVLQAGHYGVSQTRRRAILLAAAPGERLPSYPEPRHCFMDTTLTVNVDGRGYESGLTRVGSAPFRTVTIRDAMGDLPGIRNGANADPLAYSGRPRSHFQRLIRGCGAKHLFDHICKEMNPLVAMRMSLIPTVPGADWRHLPNIKAQLSDKSWSEELTYSVRDSKNGDSEKGALRGVCPCSRGAQCDPMYRQTNTIIPWCLPHTGNRHNHWAGLYGRLAWEGFFSTTVTNPEPMGKQGRVLHPEQHRVVSVRECARSQGFPDTYKFVGSVLDKHRQIGNAVPPPLAEALGVEILKSVIAKQLD